jgi:hypothetical protein
MVDNQSHFWYDSIKLHLNWIDFLNLILIQFWSYKRTMNYDQNWKRSQEKVAHQKFLKDFEISKSLTKINLQLSYKMCYRDGWGSYGHFFPSWITTQIQNKMKNVKSICMFTKDLNFCPKLPRQKLHGAMLDICKFKSILMFFL